MNDRQLYALEQIKNKNELLWYNDLTQEELLQKDENGKCLLEYALENELEIYLFEEIFQNSIEVIQICDKYGYTSFEETVLDEDLLFSEFKDTTLIEYLYTFGDINIKNIKNIHNHPEIIDILIKNNDTRFSYLSEDIIKYLSEKNSDGLYNIEKYIDNKYLVSIFTSNTLNPTAIIDLYNKYKNPELLKNINETVATYKLKNGITLYEYLYNKNFEMKLTKNVPNNKEIIDILIKNNDINALSSIPENIYNSEMEEGMTVLEYITSKIKLDKINTTINNENTILLLEKLNLLNDMNIQIKGIQVMPCTKLGDCKTIFEYMVKNNYKFTLTMWDNNLCKQLIDMNKYESLPSGFNIQNLIDINGLEKYVDAVLNGETKPNLDKIIDNKTDMTTLAEYYILLAKKDGLKYLDRFEAKQFLEIRNNKMLLTELLKIDKDLTVNKILGKYKNDVRIATILKSQGIDVETYNVGQVKKEADKYKEGLENEVGIGPIPEEGQVLLQELEDLFKNDGKSSPEIIDLLIKGYQGGLINFYDAVLSEIKNLIEIKKNNPDFIYVKDNTGYFENNTKEIHSGLSTETIMHETGHALHYFLMNTSTPDGYDELMNKLKDDPETLNRLMAFMEIVKQIKATASAQASDIVEQKGIPESENLSELLSSDLEKKKKAFESIKDITNIDEETLNEILTSMYTEEQYRNHKQRIIIKEIQDMIIKNNYSEYMTISDVFDSIYKGMFMAGLLKGPNGEEIKSWYGHGISYYSSNKNGFNELVAEFAALLKSGNAVERLKVLKSFIGDELFNMISDYYYNNIIQNTYEMDMEEEDSFSIDDVEEGRTR